MKVELTGVNVPSEHNKCDSDGCANGACTAVWGPLPAQVQVNVCARCLKDKLESGEWELVTIKKLRVGEVRDEPTREEVKAMMQEHEKVGYDLGWCIQCRRPWYDGICECGNWDDERMDILEGLVIENKLT